MKTEGYGFRRLSKSACLAGALLLGHLLGLLVRFLLQQLLQVLQLVLQLRNLARLIRDAEPGGRLLGRTVADSHDWSLRHVHS